MGLSFRRRAAPSYSSHTKASVILGMHLQEGACLTPHCRRDPAHNPRGWNLAVLCNLKALGAKFLSISKHPGLLSSPPEPKTKGLMGQEEPWGGSQHSPQGIEGAWPRLVPCCLLPFSG